MPDLTPDVERELAALDDALAGRRVAADLSELGELALALREQRPQPSPTFGSALDEKVARGFRDPDPRPRASGRRWWGAWMAPALGATATVMLVAILVVAGGNGVDEEGTGGAGGASQTESAGGTASSQSAGGGQSAAAPAAEGDMRAADEDSALSAEPEASTASPLPPSLVPPAPGTGSPGTDGRARRRVERSASLTLATRPRDIDGVSARIQEVTRQQGGFVVSSVVNSSTGGGSGTFELRVPTRNLDAAMAALSRLGNVRERSQQSRDITPAAVSARSRLRDARTERQSLLRQLGDAVTLNETASIRARLRLVSAEIEAARADVRRVNNRAAFSTVAVTLVADAGAVPPAEDAWTPGDAAEDALRVLEVAAGVGVIALAVALPLALLGGMAAIAARWTRRRRREHALDAV